MEQKQIMPFQFNANTVTTIIDEQGNPWLVAKEVCDVLGLTARDSVRYLDDDEKRYVLRTDLGLPAGKNMLLINEPGLYSLILHSRKPEAEAFKRWVTHDVLPSIRKYGGYLHIAPTMSDKEIMELAMSLSQEELEAYEKRLQQKIS